jgi:hypothetical protein
MPTIKDSYMQGKSIPEADSRIHLTKSNLMGGMSTVAATQANAGEPDTEKDEFLREVENERKELVKDIPAELRDEISDNPTGGSFVELYHHFALIQEMVDNYVLMAPTTILQQKLFLKATLMRMVLQDFEAALDEFQGEYEEADDS